MNIIMKQFLTRGVVDWRKVEVMKKKMEQVLTEVMVNQRMVGAKEKTEQFWMGVILDQLKVEAKNKKKGEQFLTEVIMDQSKVEAKKEKTE